MKKYKIINCLLSLIICVSLLTGCSNEISNKIYTSSADKNTQSQTQNIKSTSFSYKDIPEFKNEPYVEINNNKPFFKQSDYTSKSFEKYSELDNLGRCGTAFANISTDLMPTKERGAIGMIKPSGWHTVKYENVDGKYLYNRCHLIGYQLTAENANEKNLITGTRYLNIEGMLPFEDMVADYIKATGNHVLYRVTPVYKGDNLVADGVLMESWSVEDNGKGICFNIFAYNNQPGITINYADGSSYLSTAGKKGTLSNSVGNANSNTNKTTNANKQQNAQNSNQNVSNTSYVLNTNTHKFHKTSCSNIKKISTANRQDYNGSRDKIIAEGYEPCKNCNP